MNNFKPEDTQKPPQDAQFYTDDTPYGNTFFKQLKSEQWEMWTVKGWQPYTLDKESLIEISKLEKRHEN